MGKHTQGPRTIHEAREGVTREIYEVRGMNEWLVGRFDSEADARLDAAAPELLEVARWAMRAFARVDAATEWSASPPLYWTELSELDRVARAAVRKAEGK
jgi:hypothetical protein